MLFFKDASSLDLGSNICNVKILSKIFFYKFSSEMFLTIVTDTYNKYSVYKETFHFAKN